MGHQCHHNLSGSPPRTASSSNSPYSVHVPTKTPRGSISFWMKSTCLTHGLAPTPTIARPPHTLSHGDLLLVLARPTLVPILGHLHSLLLLHELLLPVLFNCLTQLSAACPGKPSPTVWTPGPRSLPAAWPCWGSLSSPLGLEVSGVPSSSPLQHIRPCLVHHCALEETPCLTYSRSSRHCRGENECNIPFLFT